MKAKDIKGLIRERIAYESNNVEGWKEEIRNSVDDDSIDIQKHAQCMELAKEYKKALEDLYDDIERYEEKGL